MNPHNEPVGEEGASWFPRENPLPKLLDSMMSRLYPQIKQGGVRHHNKYTVKYHKLKKKQPKRYHINK